MLTGDRQISAVSVCWCGCAVTVLYAVYRFCKYQLYLTSAVQFIIFGLQKKMAALVRLCVEERNRPCATEQEMCCIGLNVGKSNKLNISVGVGDFTNTFQLNSLGQLCCSFSER